MPTFTKPTTACCVQVVVRVRPPLPRELSGYMGYRNAVSVDGSGRQVILSENLAAIANSGVEGGMVSGRPRPLVTCGVWAPPRPPDALPRRCVVGSRSLP